QELEAARAGEPALQRLREERDLCGQLEEESRRQMDFDPRLLRDAIDVGCELMGVGPLRPLAGEGDAGEGEGEGEGERALWVLPELPPSWARTLDSLRPPRSRDEEIWQWRRRPLLPVSFTPGRDLSLDRVHLHLQHPFVQRVLARLVEISGRAGKVGSSQPPG
ncbi:MAG: hypothetical protein KC457_23280, partial [Myxococcales bacterium]|nr:hypothetical protein [Myxococcales bacterium]